MIQFDEHMLEMGLKPPTGLGFEKVLLREANAKISPDHKVGYSWGGARFGQP